MVCIIICSDSVYSLYIKTIITFFTFDEKTSREQFHFDGCRLEKECEEGCGQ